jgi:alkyl hydroperoxide reductase subunit AhpC
MRYTVITDDAGTILGTAQVVESQTDAGTGGPIAGPNQRLHVVEAPDDSAGREVDDLHRQLAELLAKP